VTVGTDLKRLNACAFYGCTNLNQIAWNAKSCYDLDSDDNVFYAAGKDGAGITFIIGRKVEYIPANLFYTSSNDIGGDVNLIAVENNSRLLETIGDFAFYRCQKLASVELGTTLETIGEAAFNSCSALTSITLPDALTEIGRKAFFRTGLTNAAIPHGVDEIGESAFAECAATPFVFRGYTGSYAETYAKENQIAFLAYAQSGTIGSLNWTFDYDSAVLSIRGNGAIPDYTDNPPWADCANLIDSISLSDGITGVGDHAFKNCSQLRQITIPASVTKISSTAFVGCEDLEEVYFYGAPPSFVTDAGAVADTPFPEHSRMLVYYLRGATGWENIVWKNCTISGFSDQVAYLYLRGNHNLAGDQRIKEYLGDTVSLAEYSEYVLDDLQYYSSAVKFLSWNTKEDGSGTSYATDAEIILESGTMTLYAQWDIPMMTVDGVTFDVLTNTETDTWEYMRSRNNRPGYLYLNGYMGGSIESPVPLYVYARGECTINGGIQTPVETPYNSRIRVFDECSLAITGSEKAAIQGGKYTIDLYEDAALSIRGDRATYAIHAAGVGIYGSGQMTVDSSYATAIRAAEYFEDSLSGILEIKGAQKAVYVAEGNYTFNHNLAIYNSAEGVEADEYDGGAYLRTEPMPWYLTLNANGGTWADYSGSIRKVKELPTKDIDLAPYSETLANDGYILTGWCDDVDSVEYPVDGQVVSAANLTLFAVWAARSLIVDGIAYNPNQANSGGGWTYQPASGDVSAHLALTNYHGSQIYTTGDLRVTVSGTTTITGNVGKPAIQTKGSITLETDGDTMIQGGSGESAILAAESISITNEGDLAIRGGDGGSAISTSGSLKIENNGSFSAVGGTISYALYAAEQISISGSGKDVFVSGAALRPSVSSGNLILTDDLKFYGGDNANVADRTDPAMSYPYIRIQPKTILVTLNANGGTIEGLALLSSEQAQDGSNAVLLEAGTPEWFGYEFSGWNTRADGSGVEYKTGESYQFDSGTDKLNLYAQWTEKDYDVVIGDQIKVRLREKLPAGSTALIVTYDEDGKMLSAVSGTIESNGLLRFQKDILEGADEAKLIFFDSERKPCHESYIL